MPLASFLNANIHPYRSFSVAGIEIVKDLIDILEMCAMQGKRFAETLGAWWILRLAIRSCLSHEKPPPCKRVDRIVV